MKTSGFTLIELLLVLAIIGIISAIAIPALLGQRESARNRVTQANAANIKAGIIAAINELDKAPDQRSDDMVGVTTVPGVLLKMAARPEFDITLASSIRNPHDSTKAGFRFNAAVPTIPGEVSISAPTANPTTGEPEIILGYGITKKGIPDLTPRLESVDAAR
jgi:prepilin-type N-terminal cleavage/methylation domain-containing protein